MQWEPSWTPTGKGNWKWLFPEWTLIGRQRSRMFWRTILKASNHSTLTAQNHECVDSILFKVRLPQEWLLQWGLLEQTPSMHSLQLINEICSKDLLSLLSRCTLLNCTSSCAFALPYVYVLACFRDILLNLWFCCMVDFLVCVSKWMQSKHIWHNWQNMLFTCVKKKKKPQLKCATRLYRELESLIRF